MTPPPLWANWFNTAASGAQTNDGLIVDTPIRFKHYTNAAGEFTCLQPKWKESEEEKEWGWEGESTEEEKEDEVEVEEEEEEDMKQEENVLKEEEDQIYQLKFVQHQLTMSWTTDWSWGRLDSEFRS